MGLEVKHVYPDGTSKISTIGGELKFIGYRYAILPNGYILSRDLIVLWNIALRYYRRLRSLLMRGFGVGRAPRSSDVEMKNPIQWRKPVSKVIIRSDSNLGIQSS